jgi:hypothetical protein
MTELSPGNRKTLSPVGAALPMAPSFRELAARWLRPGVGGRLKRQWSAAFERGRTRGRTSGMNELISACTRGNIRTAILLPEWVG